VVDLGATRGGLATARTWISPAGGAILTSASTLVVDAATNEALAFGTHTTVGGQLTTAATASSTAKPASGKVRSLTLYHTVPSATQPARFGLTMATATINPNVANIDPTVTAPVISKPGHTGVQIALNRTKPLNGVDCDYIYTDLSAGGNDPYLLVPFVGSYQLGDTIVQYDPNTGIFSPNSGLQISANIYANIASGTSSVVCPVNPGLLNSSVGVVPPTGGPVPPQGTSNTLYWNWPFDDTTPQATNPGLAFSPDADANSNLGGAFVDSAFVCQFQVPVSNPAFPTSPFTICSTDTPEPASPQCFKKIPPLQFWWHCLAAGTLVTLEDGRKLPIEKITNTMRVRTGYGTASVGVEATTFGRHRVRGRKPDGSVYKLVTKRGRTLILTDEHPLATPSGMVMAKRLQAGVELLAADGVDGVKSCEPILHEGDFFNLKLVDENDRRKGILHDAGTFVANGLLVGDVPAWQRHRHAAVHNLEYMQGQLARSLHKDYESALADIAQQP
jgi:hypothetical protein